MSILKVLDWSSKQPMSLSVVDSDYFGNLLHMEVLVATLVKYGNGGAYEPYVAQNWKINDQKTIFQFTIAPGFSDENNLKITAPVFKKSLERLFAIYIKSYEPPVFSDLKGWGEFKRGKSKEIDGISAPDDSTLIFKFNRSASGVMEFLAMPYYGFYSPENFDINGNWKEKGSIVSSGPYAVQEFSKDRVLLKQRKNYKFSNQGGFQQIEIKKSQETEAGRVEDYTLIITSDLNNDFRASNLSWVKSVPTVLFSLVINPHISPFNDIEKRRKFYNAARTTIANNKDWAKDFKISEGFYKKFTPQIVSDNNEKAIGEPIMFQMRDAATKGNNLNSYFSDVIDAVSKKLNLKINTQIRKVDKANGSFNPTDDYHLKFASVDIGNRAENWVVKMMFCSDLGVSFPDPSGRVCQLTEKFDRGDFLDAAAYEEEFEKIIYEDAVVLPIFMTGFTFLYSENIDSNSISQTSNVPRLDLILKR